jgi:nuclear pore complex protein Nup188
LSPGLRKFFADSATQNILQKPFAPFEPQQNSQFATLTAAINVTPDDNGPYDIKQIKGDALWLAEAVQIDKVAALRIVVLEWQKRPAARLLSRPLGDEERPDSDSALDLSIFAPKPTDADGPKETNGPAAASFDSTYQRQLRLIQLSISEAFYVLATSELKARQFASVHEASTGQNGGGPNDEVGRLLFQSLCPQGDGSQTIEDGADAIRRSLDLLRMDMDDPAVENNQKTLRKYWEELQGFWIRAYTMQVISALQLIFTVADFASQMPSAEAVLSYFELMSEHDFFGADTVSRGLYFNVD